MNETLTRYQASLRSIESQREKLKSGDQKWNTLRVVLFLIASATFALSFAENFRWLWPLSVVAILAFLVVITLHQRLRDEIESLRNSRSVLRRLIARCERNWDRLPVWKPHESEPTDAPERATTPASLSNDLDIFGKGSLFQLVSMASTGPGLRTLGDWIVGTAMAAPAMDRYEAGHSIADKVEFRERLYKLARRAASGTADPDHFLNWIKQPSWLAKHPLLSVWSYLAPLLVIVLLVSNFVVDDASILRTIRIALVAVILINALISTFLLGDVHQIFSAAIAGRGDVEGYHKLFALAEELPREPNINACIIKRLGSDETNASTAMTRLGRIAMATSIKQVAILFPVYIVLQMVGLWELHVLRRLEAWQDRYRKHAAGWFDALGDLEAIGSVAALMHEYPLWAKPQWVEASDDATLIATSLGHPLLKDAHRVCNDVTIGPTGTLLLVTGSNMSGKSTMLRSVGLNVLLAGAGAPVCAGSLAMPSIELATSIRVRDNLDEGVSFYMAELQSLARVVRHAERISKDKTSRAKLLFLLDEILQGTNSRERQIAVSHVLKHLIRCCAIGAITTHDLELADDEELKTLARTVHFRETITTDREGRDTMTFDYVMREGISPTTNALRLLEIVGLGKAK